LFEGKVRVYENGRPIRHSVDGAELTFTAKHGKHYRVVPA
jgi:hypothetical protein